MKFTKSIKLKFASVIALGLTFCVTLGSFFGLTAANAARDVTVNQSSVFTATGEAVVRSHEFEVPAGSEGENEEEDKTKKEYYTSFVFKGEEDTVNYRKNLAFNWFYNSNPEPEEEKDEDKEEDKDEGENGDGEDNNEEQPPVTLSKAEGWFKAEIGFVADADGKLPFEKFILTFESQQFTLSKDKKAVNYVIFFPSADGKKVSALITDDKDAELPEGAAQLSIEKLTISFSDKNENEECAGGEYFVTVSDGTVSVCDKFVNIGGTYAKYSSSTTTPVTPLSFAAIYPEEDENEPEARANAVMVIYSLNGQSFKLSGNAPSKNDDGYFSSGTVSDNTPPVLCLDKGVSFIGEGEEISFRYTVIDVITSSPSIETSYFMLTKTQAADDTFNAEAYKTDGLYRVVADSDDQKMIPHTNHYVPAASDYNGGVAKPFGENFKVTAAVKVLLKLTDTTSTNGESTYVMLDWYVDDDYLLNVGGTKYIAIANDEEGASYGHTSNGATDYESADWKAAFDEYQKAVTEKVEKDDLKAGSKNYFYLPSLEKLFADNATRYEDLSFNIYYNNGSQQQQSNRSYNDLSINLTKAGKYVFTVYVTDASGNPMYYYEDGEKKELKTGDIWDIYKNEDGNKDLLPWFEFTVSASELSIEEPEEQSIAYVGSTYTPDAFEINGVTHTTEYRLLRFDNERYAADNGGKAMTYDEFMSRKNELSNPENRKYFTEIYAANDLEETDEEYEIYHPYAWNKTSPSFIPQDDNAFYLIECKATSKEGGTQEAKAYMGIASAPKVKALKGEDTWVQDNMTSIILLCIAGASLIGIVLLLVIKPRDKGDLDDGIIETEVKPKKQK